MRINSKLKLKKLSPSKYLKSILLLLLLFAYYSTPIISQSTRNLPAFYPTAEYSYHTTEGLLDNCMLQVFMSREGRLYIQPCTGTAFNQSLYEYDGKRTYPTKVKITPKPSRFYVDGQDSLGRFLGLYYNRKKKKASLTDLLEDLFTILH